MAMTSYTVVKGDCLWSISLKFYRTGTKWGLIADENNISRSNPTIYTNQVLRIPDGSSSSGATSSTTSNSNRPVIDFVGPQAGVDRTLYVHWSWSKSNTDSYKIKWFYDSGNGEWFSSGETTVNAEDLFDKNATYSIPQNALIVRVRIKPVAKTRKVNNEDVAYWTADWSKDYSYNVLENYPPSKLSTPSISIDKYKLTAELNNIDSKCTDVQFQVVKDNTSVFATSSIKISTSSAKFTCTVDAGGEYKIRCRGVRNGVYGEWSEYSNNVETAPATPEGITTIRANTLTSVYMEWAAVANAKSYEIEYSTKLEYFDNTGTTESVTGIESTNYQKIGLETGNEYFFRIRAVNDGGNSGWSEISNVVVGKKPVAPTTWSSTTTAIVGEPLNLYWVHNSADGSSQKSAYLELKIGEQTLSTQIVNDRDEDEKDNTSVYSIDTSLYPEGTKILWRVKTSGVTGDYGDFSVQRTVDIYARPTVTLQVKDVNETVITEIESFPIYISALPGPESQQPIGYHVEVIANGSYETIDSYGEPKSVNNGDSIYSKHYDINRKLELTLTADSIDLENNVEYTIKCTASMNSGLTAEANTTLPVAWTDEVNVPNGEIFIDNDTLVAYIHPYCLKTEEEVLRDLEFGGLSSSGDDVEASSKIRTSGYYDILRSNVSIENGDAKYRYKAFFYNSSKVFMSTSGSSWITTGDVTIPNGCRYMRLLWTYYDGRDVSDDDISKILSYITVIETDYMDLDEDVMLSVYRREFDGSYTEIGMGLDNVASTYIVDPHPSLDYARYRIVSTSKTTGAMNYCDLPGYPVKEDAIIIQWADTWKPFDAPSDGEVTLEKSSWSGSMLKLLYNVDVSDSGNNDVSLIEYVGRKHPVSYYGTQLGETSTWNVEIEKDDVETLHAIRRLKSWMGDVYVREPSGTGYWANVNVSYSQKHCELTIPVTFNLTRVEGGM